jgi:hypothetical protein
MDIFCRSTITSGKEVATTTNARSIKRRGFGGPEKTKTTVEEGLAEIKARKPFATRNDID